MSDTGPIDVPQSKCECPHHKTSDDVKPFVIVTLCPKCRMKHIDTGIWKTKLHKRHQCQNDLCPVYLVTGNRFEWTPALVFTVGVAETVPKGSDVR